jgi:hypothetical protein
MAIAFQLCFGYVVRSVQMNQEGLNGTQQLLSYADDVNILGEIIHTAQKTQTVLDASKEVRLEMNPEKAKYTRMLILRYFVLSVALQL